MIKPISKQIRRQLELMRYPMVLVVPTKAEDIYFGVVDETSLRATFLELLKRFVGAEMMVKPPLHPVLEEGEVNDQAMFVMPEPYRAQAAKVRAVNDKLRKAHADALEQWAEVEAALAEKDGLRAYAVVHAWWGGAERYRTWRLEQLQMVAS